MTWNSGTMSNDADWALHFGLGRWRPAHRRRDTAHDDVLEVRDRLAVRERRTLGLTGRARRVEDREQVVLFDEAGRVAAVVAGRGARRTRAPDARRARRSRTHARSARISGNRSRTISMRRSSAMSTFASESLRPNSSSSAFHHALSGTRTAPRIAHAHHVSTHSGLFAEHSATRSPRSTPSPARSTADEHAREPVVLAERVPAVTLNQPVEVAARVGLLHQLAQRRHALLVDLRGVAEDVFDDDLEGSAGPGELREDRVRARHDQAGSGARSACTTSNDHSSLPVPTGPCVLCELVAVLERRAVQPRVEVGGRPPLRVDEDHVTVVGGDQQLERLEPRHLRDLTGSVGEALDQRRPVLGGDSDRIDTDD